MISRKQIIEKAITLAKDADVIPMALCSQSNYGFALEQLNGTEIDEEDDILFTNALAYLFCCLWRIAYTIMNISGSTGLPIYKYEFLSKHLRPLAFEQLYEALGLLEEDDIMDVLSSDGAEHFNPLCKIYFSKDKDGFIKYCMDNKLGKACNDIYGYLFKRNHKTLNNTDYLFDKNTSVESIEQQIYSGIQNSGTFIADFFPDMNLYINHSIEIESLLFWCCVFKQQSLYSINNSTYSCGSNSKYNILVLWERYKNYFSGFDFKDNEETLDSKAAKLLSKEFYNYFKKLILENSKYTNIQQNVTATQNPNATSDEYSDIIAMWKNEIQNKAKWNKKDEEKTFAVIPMLADDKFQILHKALLENGYIAERTTWEILKYVLGGSQSCNNYEPVIWIKERPNNTCCKRSVLNFLKLLNISDNITSKRLNYCFICKSPSNKYRKFESNGLHDYKSKKDRIATSEFNE